MFSELRCVMLWFSDMGEVQEGLESAFAAAESSSGVAQPAPGALRRWFQGALQQVHEGDWGIYPRGHYVTLVCPDAAIEVQSEREEIIYRQQAFRVAQVMCCCTRTLPMAAPGRCQPFPFRWLCVNVHCPSSVKRPFNADARQGVLEGLLALGHGGTSPMLVGGDLNFSLFALRAGLQEAGVPEQKTFIAMSRDNKPLHGDLAVALGGLVALKENSDMGKSFGGLSDNHDLVLVPLARVGSGVASQMVPSAAVGARSASAAQRGQDPPPKSAGALRASAAQPGQEPREEPRERRGEGKRSLPPPPPAAQLRLRPPPPTAPQPPAGAGVTWLRSPGPSGGGNRWQARSQRSTTWVPKHELVSP